MTRTPVIFVGHGSPMNAIETNIFTESWKTMMSYGDKPKAILIFSAHWITHGETKIGSIERPDIIYDMYGFPEELYKVQYPARGDFEVVDKVTKLVPWIQKDTTRGLDHGIWSVLIHMFPESDIPVIPVSLDYNLPPKKLFELGRLIRELRDEGILIMGSGNIVHNLRAIDWSGTKTYPWAEVFDKKVTDLIQKKDFEWLFRFQEWGDISFLSHPSIDHLLPLFPLLGATHESDIPEFFTSDIVMGSISMRSVRWYE